MSTAAGSARYAVGIDLGTTHSVISYVELSTQLHTEDAWLVDEQTYTELAYVSWLLRRSLLSAITHIH